MKTRMIFVVALLFVCGLGGCAAPHPESKRAFREQNLESTAARFVELQAGNPEYLDATARRLVQLVNGNPDRANATLMHVLELD